MFFELLFHQKKGDSVIEGAHIHTPQYPILIPRLALLCLSVDKEISSGHFSLPFFCELQLVNFKDTEGWFVQA